MISLSSGYLESMSERRITLWRMVLQMYVLAGILSRREDSSVPISTYSALRSPYPSRVSSG
jgi:hypothetical protein